MTDEEQEATEPEDDTPEEHIGDIVDDAPESEEEE